MSTTIIQSQASLVQLVSKYIKLQEGRKMLKGNCPFHKDDTNSFMVYPEKNIFKCFGCGKEGGPVEFIMIAEGITADDAVRRLGKEIGLFENKDF